MQIIEGPGGVNALLGAKIDIDWSKEGYEGITTSAIKEYNSEIHTQSSIECMLQLRSKNKINPGDVKAIEAQVTEITYNFAGGGSYGNSTNNINSKEQADHSLQYLVAVALIDGAVGPAQFDPARIKKPDVQELLCRVTARPNAAFTQAYPQHMPAKMTVQTNDGKTVTEEVQDYPGMPVRPFTWEQSAAKYESLTQGRIDKPLADEIVAAVQGIETTSARDLLALLNKVPTPQAPATA